MNKGIKHEDVLSYNPNLELNSQNSFRGKSIEYIKKPIKIDNYKSAILKSFEAYHPSIVVSKLTKLISKTKSYLKQIEEETYKGNIVRQYCFFITEEEKRLLYEKNFEDLYGDSKFESYVEMAHIKTELSEVRESLIEGIYKVKKFDYLFDDIDSLSIDKLNYYEYEKRYENINYFSLFYDIQISYILLRYCKDIELIVEDLYSIENIKEVSLVNSEIQLMLNKKFNRINEIMKHDLFKDKNIDGSIKVSLHNIFLDKQDLNVFIDGFSSVYSLKDDCKLFDEIRVDNFREIESKIEDLISVCMLSTIYKGDIYESILNKSKIREFFIK